MKRFKAGKTYSTRSICDSNCIFKFEITRRTAKSVWIVGESIKEATRRATYEYDGRECIKPFGSYSMAPILRA